MADSSNHKMVKISQRDLKRLHKLSRILYRDLKELKRDPHLSRRSDIANQLDEALRNASETKESLKELCVREAVWPRSCNKSTQTPHSRSDALPCSSKQWNNVGQLIHQLNETVSYGSERLRLPIQNESISHRHHQWWCEQSNQHLLPTINHWLDRWSSEKDEEAEKDRIEQGHTKHESESRAKKKGSETEEMVAHFQKLFDVPMRDGVYTRLHDVYNRFGELMNVLNVLKDILGLDKDVPISRVVAVVRKLCDLHSESSTHLLRYLLQADDLNRMILRIDEYHKFFPVFEKVGAELMAILEVDSLTHVIPAVKALKLLQL